MEHANGSFKPLIFLLTVALLLSSHPQWTMCDGKKVDCRKYVYAPICRGAAAKRATIQKLEPLLEDRRIPRFFEAKNEWKDTPLVVTQEENFLNDYNGYENKKIIEKLLEKFAEIKTTNMDNDC